MVVSGNASASPIGSSLTAAAVPVVSLENQTFDDLGLATNRGNQTGQTTIKIADDTHAITAGYSVGQVVTVLNSSGGMGYAQSPPTGKLANINGGGAKSTITTRDTGETLTTGGTAPARRVGFFADGSLPNKLNTVGWEFFDRSIVWALNGTGSSGPGTSSDTVGLGTATGAAQSSGFSADMVDRLEGYFGATTSMDYEAIEFGISLHNQHAGSTGGSRITVDDYQTHLQLWLPYLARASAETRDLMVLPR